MAHLPVKGRTQRTGGQAEPVACPGLAIDHGKPQGLGE
jgi:hypothetical protein